MINLIGNALKQWDIDRKIQILDKNIVKISFSNDHYYEQEVCTCDEDGVVTIPNKLLQTAQDIDVYGINADGKTIYSCVMSINSKDKPSNYPANIGSYSHSVFDLAEYGWRCLAYDFSDIALNEDATVLNATKDDLFVLLQAYKRGDIFVYNDSIASVMGYSEGCYISFEWVTLYMSVTASTISATIYQVKLQLDDASNVTGWGKFKTIELV